MSTELLACPFCGSPGVIWAGDKLCGCDDLVQCDSCDYTIHGSSPADAIARWNRRTPTTQVGEPDLPDRIVAAVIRDLSGRRGYGLDDIDDDVRKEMLGTLRTKVAALLPTAPPRVTANDRRYRYLRERDLGTIKRGGVFAGQTPDNVVLSGDDLDKAIDDAMARAAK